MDVHCKINGHILRPIPGSILHKQLDYTNSLFYEKFVDNIYKMNSFTPFEVSSEFRIGAI